MRRPAHSKSPSESKVGDKILALFARKPRERLTPAEILRRAGLARDELQLVIEALRELCRDGQLVRLKKNHYALADREHLVKGRVHTHPNGYGFLIPEDRDLQDLYLNRREMRRVMHGDQVMVRIDRKARGGTESHIVRVLERGQKRLLGTYDELNGHPIVIPMDARISPIALAKAAAKTEKGKVIAVEVSRYGTALSSPEAQIVNIDGENARDFDDAVYVRKQGETYELYVSIADVAHYVAPDTALDQEAYARSTSVYFPDRAIPMLPEALSNGICSLKPHEDRLTKTVCIEINAKGDVIRSRFFNSVIRSNERMTYTDVRRILVDHDPECLARYSALVDEFKRMEELALLLYERRRARGNLDFDLPEAEIILDLQGLPENIVRAERNIAHQYFPADPANRE